MQHSNQHFVTDYRRVRLFTNVNLYKNVVRTSTKNYVIETFWKSLIIHDQVISSLFTSPNLKWKDRGHFSIKFYEGYFSPRPL